MSFGGFMKQINKANQLLNEKIGGAKGTEIDNNFHSMERRTDSMNKLIEDVRERTYEYLQPNPASRAKLNIANNLCKMRGQAKSNPYPQPEGTLGETMIKYGKDLGEDSQFGQALTDVGENLRQMAGIKYALEDNIKQNFLDPLANIKDNEIKEVMHLRKKTENRRLDYDCKKRKKSSGSVVNEEDLQQSEVKFEESKLQTEVAMNRLLQNEFEQVTHLMSFAEGFLEYHSQCYEILKGMVSNLNERKLKISNGVSNGQSSSSHRSVGYPNGSIKQGGNSKTDQPPSYGLQMPEIPNKQPVDSFYPDEQIKMPELPPKSNDKPPTANSNFKMPFDFSSLIQTPSPQPQPTNQRTPCCRALYDFEAENDEELEFKEGQTIKLITRLDENWLEGEANSKRGRFPISYVEITVPLPS